MEILNVEQGSKAWHDARRCMVTGTKLEDVMGTPLARLQLICELIAEEATEQTKTIRITDEMQRGTDEEEFAIKLIEEVTKSKLVRGGMWKSQEYDFLACSPDAYKLEKNGDVYDAFEVKNPDSKTVIFDRLTSMVSSEELGLTKSKIPFLGIPAQYKWQAVNYFLNNRKLRRLHFGLHDARFIDPKQKLSIVTLDRDNETLQEAINEADAALITFKADWDKYKEIVSPADF